MTSAGPLDRRRDACWRRAWAEAYARFAEADRESPLAPEDLEVAATAAYLVGRFDAGCRTAGARPPGVRPPR